MQRRSILFVLILVTVGFGSSSAADLPAHDESDCSLCHREGRGPGATSNRVCESCHAVRGVVSGDHLFHTDGQKSCLRCHLFHAPDRLSIQIAGFAPHASRGRTRDLTVCAICHRSGDGAVPRIPDKGHRLAARWYHDSMDQVTGWTVSQTCLRCHGGATDLPDQIADAAPPSQMSLRTSHPYGIRMVTAGFSRSASSASAFPSLPLIDGRIECTTCHDLLATEDPARLRARPVRVLCAECHPDEIPGGEDDHWAR